MKHLSLTSRCMIEKYITFGYSFCEIAAVLPDIWLLPTSTPIDFIKEAKSKAVDIYSRQSYIKNSAPRL